jgi:hypothetical protein
VTSRTEPLSPVTIGDFALGIYGSYHGGSGAPATVTSRMSTPRNGAATIENTYACCADPNSNALIPLPARTAGQTDAVVGNTANYPSGRVEMRTLDAACFPTLANSANGRALIENVYIGYGFRYDNAGGSTYRWYILGRGYRAGTIRFDWLYARALNNTSTTIPQLQVERTRSGADTATVPVSADFQIPVLAWLINVIGTSFATGAIGATDQLTGMTYGTDRGAWGNWQTTSGGVAVTGTYPNPATPSSFAMKQPTSMGGAIHYLVAHAGRLVGYHQLAQAFGLEYAAQDYLQYTAVSQFWTTSVDDGAGSNAFLEENPGFPGVMASMNAQDLFLVKHTGGGALIRGGLQSGTVVRLPAIESTGGYTSKPVHAPGVGLVYLSRNGVFAYDGSTKTQRLSPQIDGAFWRYWNESTYTYDLSCGRLGYFYPWVCVPNDYLFDTRTGSWWRLTDPNASGHAAYNVYDVGPNTGKLYAFPHKIDANNTRAWDTYDASVLSSTYSWQSQPLIESVDKVLSFSAYNLIAMAAPGSTNPRITVTFTGYASDGTATTPVTETLNLNATNTQRPQFFERNMKAEFQGRYVQVRFEAAADTGPAPSIMPGFTILTRPERQPPRT